jgi:hypothetical protein
MYRTFLFTLLVAVILTACNNSLSSPTPTPTLAPFSALQLDALIIQPYDLPSGVTGAQINHHETCDPSTSICADSYISQDLEFDNEQHGKIQIWVYESSENRSKRYDVEVAAFITECARAEGQCVDGYAPQPVSDLGMSARMIIVKNYMGKDSYFLVFARCHAVAKVEMITVISDPNNIIVYAQHLDERLTPIVCR